MIAGRFRGRRLEVPPGLEVRPTSDRAREALFGILGPSVAGAGFLDLFSGSGAVGIEACSRGAAPVVLIEKDPVALRALERNLASLGLDREIRLIRASWPGALEALRGGAAFPVLFADPPYEGAPYAAILAGLSESGIAARDAVCVLEHDARKPPPPRGGSFQALRTVRYGRVAFSFYRRTETPATP